MNAVPEKLLPRLGSAKGPDGRWRCPLHSAGESCLDAGPAPEVEFSCSHPVCRFRGDAAALVSFARGVSLEEAVKSLAEGGDLADCMAEPMKAEVAEEYLAPGSQTVLKAYLARCVRALRAEPEKSGVRAGMSRNNLRLLHPDMGLFLDEGDSTPKCLREFTKPRYRKSSLILYPFTWNGEVTRIEVLDPADPAFRYVAVVTRSDIGVFGEKSAAMADRLFVLERPEAAAKMWAAWTASSAKRPQIVSFNAYPLPEGFAPVDRFELDSPSDSEISTKFLLDTLAAPEIKAGKPPSMRVHRLGRDSGKVTADELLAVDSRKTGMFDIQYLLARRFSDMAEAGNGGDILGMLAEARTPAVVRNLVKATAENQLRLRNGFDGKPGPAARLASILDSSDGGEPASVSLANGKVLHCGPDGVFAIRPGGTREPMANVGLAVDSRTVSDDDEVFECTVTAKGGFPAVSVGFRWRDLTADRMRAAVQRSYAGLGLSPYVAFYTVSGFAWRDVMSRLAENCRVDRAEPIELSKPVSGGTIGLKPIKEQE